MSKSAEVTQNAIFRLFVGIFGRGRAPSARSWNPAIVTARHKRLSLPETVAVLSPTHWSFEAVAEFCDKLEHST